jgi:hypothetical protein
MGQSPGDEESDDKTEEAEVRGVKREKGIRSRARIEMREKREISESREW